MEVLFLGDRSDARIQRPVVNGERRVVVEGVDEPGTLLVGRNEGLHDKRTCEKRPMWMARKWAYSEEWERACLREDPQSQW